MENQTEIIERLENINMSINDINTNLNNNTNNYGGLGGGLIVIIILLFCINLNIIKLIKEFKNK